MAATLAMNVDIKTHTLVEDCLSALCFGPLVDNDENEFWVLLLILLTCFGRFSITSKVSKVDVSYYPILTCALMQSYYSLICLLL